jgi:hypothetical protein
MLEDLAYHTVALTGGDLTAEKHRFFTGEIYHEFVPIIMTGLWNPDPGPQTVVFRVMVIAAFLFGFL